MYEGSKLIDTHLKHLLIKQSVLFSSLYFIRTSYSFTQNISFEVTACDDNLAIVVTALSNSLKLQCFIPPASTIIGSCNVSLQLHQKLICSDIHLLTTACLTACRYHLHLHQ